MNNNLKKIREENNLTQKELSEKSNISLRTIQRIESGSVLKGHTLKTLSETLKVTTKELTQVQNTENLDFTESVKKINTATLLSLLIPYGTIIIPFLMIRKTKNIKAKKLAKQILSFQIIWTILLSISLILSIFLNGLIKIKFPIFLTVLLFFYISNIFILLKNNQLITKSKTIYNPLKINFL